jgi:hypothetical protein
MRDKLLAFVAMESSELATNVKQDPTSSEGRYRTSFRPYLLVVILSLCASFYRLYQEGCETTSKAASDPEESSIRRIRASSITPPYTSATIKLGISKLEVNPGLFADVLRFCLVMPP